MSLYGSLMADVEDDPFFGSHMRHMRQMNNMMNSLFSDPFGMLGGLGSVGLGSMGLGSGGLGSGGLMSIEGPRHGSSLMPFMPQMPSLNRLFSGELDGHMGAASSFSSSTVVMSSGPNGKPQVYSSTSSTKIGPNGVKETRKTLQDSRTGTKKMSIGHHIGERAHVVEREANVYSGDQEERQEFINIEEDDAEDFDREFQQHAGAYVSRRAPLPAIAAPLPAIAAPLPAIAAPLPAIAAPLPAIAAPPATSSDSRHRFTSGKPSSRRPIRTVASPLALTSSNVREVYSSSHPQRRHKHKHRNTHSPTDN